MLFGYIDPVYILFALPGFVLSVLASMYVKSTFARYSRVGARSAMTGAEAARAMLYRTGVRDVDVVMTGGTLTDHYDPRTRTLRLSRDVFASQSLAAIGVACHEAGHALQHAQDYAPLTLRSALVPATNFGSRVGMWVVLAGFLFRSQQMILLGAVLFSAAVVFALVTLPVEWNASARAKQVMVSSGIVTREESHAAGQVLNAAFLTYVAAAVSAALTLLYFLMRAGLFGGRRD